MMPTGPSHPNGRLLRQLLSFLLILAASASLALDLNSAHRSLTWVGMGLVVTGMLIGLVTP